MKYLYLILIAGLGIYFIISAIKGMITGEINLSSWQGSEDAIFKESPLKFIYIITVKIVGGLILIVAGLFFFATQ